MKKNKYVFYIIFAAIILLSFGTYVYAADDTITLTFGCSDQDIKEVMTLIKRVYNIIRYATPLILVIAGSIDFFKATMAGKVDDMEKYKKKFMNRLMLGIGVFLLLSLFEIITSILVSSGITDSDSWMACWNSLWIR
ncbi:MAG: hypothetical protein IJ565_02675 [Bacilli bacterium]|nr:hypothetical protein [Bacilli bacterium]